MDYQIKQWEDVGLSDNYVFQKVMEDDELCREILERILDVKLSKIVKVTTEKVIEDIYMSKGIRVDAYVCDGKGTVYDIEAQTSDIKDILAKRVRYYQSCIDMNLLLKGSKYKNLKDVYIIFICNFDPIGLKYSQYKFKTIDVENHKVVLDDGRTIIFLNSHGKDQSLNQGLKNILELFNGNKVAGDELIDRLDAAVKRIKGREGCYMEWARRQADLEDQFSFGEARGKIKAFADMVEDGFVTCDMLIKNGRATAEEVAQVEELLKERKQEQNS